MLFSIVVPTYNSGELINKCVESINKQSEKDLELIIIDDGSSDGSTDDIESRFSDINIQCFRIQNGGVSAARNYGLNRAKGKYIVFVDADDELPDNALSTYKNVIEENGKVDIILAGFHRCYPQKESAFRVKTENRLLVYSGDKKIFNPYVSRFTGCVWGKCYNKQVIDNNRFDSSLKLCEDAEFNFRVFPKASNIIYVNELLYRYTYLETSTIRKFNPNYINEYVRAIKKIQDKISNTVCYNEFLEFACNVFNVICYNVIFSNNNQMPLQGKLKTTREVMSNTVFGQIIKEVNLQVLPIKHRVTIMFAKTGFVYGIYLLSLVNRVINKILY